MLVYYNVFANGRRIIGIPSVWLSAHIQCRVLAHSTLSSLFYYVLLVPHNYRFAWKGQPNLTLKSALIFPHSESPSLCTCGSSFLVNTSMLIIPMHLLSSLLMQPRFLITNSLSQHVSRVYNVSLCVSQYTSARLRTAQLIFVCMTSPSSLRSSILWNIQLKRWQRKFVTK